MNHRTLRSNSHRWAAASLLLLIGLASPESKAASQDNRIHTIRAVVPFPALSGYYGLTTATFSWNVAFPDSNYRSVCSDVASPRVFANSLSPIQVQVGAKTPSTLTVAILMDESSTSPISMTVNCVGISTGFSGSLHGGTVKFTSNSDAPPANQQLTWDVPMASSNYYAVCSSSRAINRSDFETYPFFWQKSATGMLVGETTTGVASSVDCIAEEPGVSSALRGATGTFANNQNPLIGWDTPFPNTNYTTACGIGSLTGNQVGAIGFQVGVNAQQTNGTTISVRQNDVTAQDSTEVDCIGVTEGFRIVDPYAGGALLQNSTSVYLASASPDYLTGLKSDVVGLTADGTSRVLLILNTSAPSVVFEAGEGCFFTISTSPLSANCPSSTGANTVKSDPVVANGGYAIVWYIAPRDYSSSGDPTDTSTSRTIAITTVGDPSNTVIPIQVFRPPQFLIHGLWSNPGTWKSVIEGENGLNVFTADWSYLNNAGEGLNTVVPDVEQQLLSDLAKFRDQNNVAISQMDLIGHSMGGLIARSIADASSFRISENYTKGPVHKLISIGTPYRGSPFATNLATEFNDLAGCSLVKRLFPRAGMPIAGAIQTLSATSEIVPPPVNLPMHAIIGDAGAFVEAENESGVFFKIAQMYCGDMKLSGGYRGVFNEDSDLIVGVDSQADRALAGSGGFEGPTAEEMSGAIHTTFTLLSWQLFFYGEPELSYQGTSTSGNPPSIVSRLITLLNSPVSSPVFTVSVQ